MKTRQQINEARSKSVPQREKDKSPAERFTRKDIEMKNTRIKKTLLTLTIAAILCAGTVFGAETGTEGGAETGTETMQNPAPEASETPAQPEEPVQTAMEEPAPEAPAEPAAPEAPAEPAATAAPEAPAAPAAPEVPAAPAEAAVPAPVSEPAAAPAQSQPAAVADTASVSPAAVQTAAPVQTMQTAAPSAESAPAGTGGQDTAAKTIVQDPARVKLDGIPFEIKAELPKTLTKGSFYEIKVEVKNLQDKDMENLQLILHSKESGYVITSYKDLEEAQREVVSRGIVTEGENRNDEREIRVGLLGGYSSWKEEHVIIYAKEDIEIGSEKLSADARFELTSGGTVYYGDGKWKIDPQKESQTEGEPAPQDPEGEAVPYDENTDTVIFMDETLTDGEEGLAETNLEGEADGQASIEEEEIDTMQAAAQVAEETEDELQTAVLVETPQDDEEMITVEVIDDGEDETGEDEELLEDWEYYDDWGYYGGFDEGQVINTATPYVLVKSYRHKKTIYTGDAFGIEIELLNTSQKAPMDNVVVKVETSEALSLANGTNTLFINGIEAGGTSVQRLDLLAAAECKEPTQKLDLSISFEYVENNERKKGEAAESITLPIAPKDRLELQDPVYDEMQAGKEGVISIPYVNKGYTSLHNLEATLVLDNAQAAQKSIYAGNVESGKNGTLDFLVTPEMDGDYAGNVTLKYEDSSQKEVSVVVPLEFTSTMAYVEDDLSLDEEMPMEEEYEQKSASIPLIISIAAAALIAVIASVMVIRKKKKAKADQDVDLDEWFGDDEK